MENFQQNINAQLSANNAGIHWAQTQLRGASLREVKRKLLDNKVTLTYLNDATHVKPGVALFGASQVGKSYLSNYLLATESKPLHVYDNTGNSVGFLNTIDPAGNGKEATALVTRFSMDNTCGPNSNYPYRVELLRPIEIVMTLVDGYFNDVKGQIVSNKEEIEEEKRRLLTKFSSIPKGKSIITPEDVCELRNYFNTRYLSQRPDFCENLEKSDYFGVLDSIADRISSQDLIDVFGFLWGHNPIIIEVFSSIVNIYERLNFSKEVNVSLDALRRDEGTILHVDRIYELVGLNKLSQEMRSTVEPAKVKEMSALLPDGTIAFNIQKSHLCMIAREVAFTVVNINDQSQIEFMEKEKPFFKTMDILDFPGARSRKEILASGFNYDGVAHMLVRGKVAFLFNKYSHQYLISSLIFCQDNSQANVTSLPRLIDGWVRDNVGKDLSERTQLMRATNGISPLLMVATKFNEYLKQANNLTISDSERRREEMMSIWVRMASALSAAAVIAGSTDSWFDNWTNDSPFKVIFPLRGFKYSAELYDGYIEVDDRITSRENKKSPHFSEIYNDLRKTFLDTRSEFIQLHLNDSEYLWDKVTGVDEDGSKPILGYLDTVATEIGKIRKDTFERIMAKCFEQLADILLKFYHDDNSAAELSRQRKAASRLRMSLDVQFGRDKDFFSDFIGQMMIDESNLHDVILNAINDTKHVEAADIEELFAIREHAGISQELSVEENKQKLKDSYGCDSDEELQELFDEMNISIEQIISPAANTNMARLIAGAVELEWMDTHLISENYEQFQKRGLKMAQIESLLDNIRALYTKRLSISDKIAARINPFVAGAGAIDELSDMLADICAQIINKFVSTMGAAYYDENDWSKIETLISQMHLTINLNKNDIGKSSFDPISIRNYLPEVFGAFDSSVSTPNHQKEAKKYMSNWVEYQNWIDFMEVSYLANIGIPTYDVAMNDALRTIIDTKIVNAPDLACFVKSHKGLNDLVTIKPIAS